MIIGHLHLELIPIIGSHLHGGLGLKVEREPGAGRGQAWVTDVALAINDNQEDVVVDWHSLLVLI